MSPTEFFGTFIKKLRLAKAELQSDSGDFPSMLDTETHAADERDANLVTSRYKGEGIETHALLIDLDVNHAYVPSTTPGHGHLIVDVMLSRPEWQAVMRALEKAGVHSRGYTEASLSRGFSSLRLPWVKKDPT